MAGTVPSVTPRAPATVLRWSAPALLALAALILATAGVGEAGAGEVVRWTARTSLLFFAPAFAAWGLAPSSWPARNRDGLLASLAVSHALHLVGILALAAYTGGANLYARGSVHVLVGGGLAYAVIALGWLCPRSPAVTWGLFWVWGVFAVSYAPRVLHSPLAFGPALALLAVALGLRLRGLVAARGALTPARRRG